MKTAEIRKNGNSQWHVIFGNTDSRGEFYVSHARPSRMYSTIKGAEKAKIQWESL